MKHGSLFSGIGGFDLAAEWMGWDNIFHCEWNEFGQKILKYYWPKAISYDDITKTDFTIHRGAIDVLTGGFPCQPYSNAGKRLGKEDERHLWPEMLRAIREIQPNWVVGENVRGLVNWNGGLVFDEVQSDLEAAGYEIFPFLLPAAGINAPHERYRIWFVAHSRNQQFQERAPNRNEPNTKKKAAGLDNRFKRQGNLRDVADTLNSELQRSQFYRSIEGQRALQTDGGQFSRSVCGEWENFPTQPPICDGNDGLSDLLDGITFSTWRVESIKAGGNAVVPQLVHQIFKAIEQYEQITNGAA